MRYTWGLGPNSARQAPRGPLATAPLLPQPVFPMSDRAPSSPLPSPGGLDTAKQKLPSKPVASARNTGEGRAAAGYKHEAAAPPGRAHRRAAAPPVSRVTNAGTHQQVGAAIISLRHRLPGAASASPRQPPKQPRSKNRTASPARRHAQQTPYIGRRPFPTAPAKLAPHWARRTQASGEPDQPLPRAWLEIEVKGERGVAGPRGRGHGLTNQRPGGVRGPTQAFGRRLNGSCLRGPLEPQDWPPRTFC